MAHTPLLYDFSLLASLLLVCFKMGLQSLHNQQEGQVLHSFGASSKMVLIY